MNGDGDESVGCHDQKGFCDGFGKLPWGEWAAGLR
jgi:hypothetical protein